MPRLLFAISAHGLGHLGQAAPVCNALHDLCPDIELSIWSALPAEVLNQRISAPFTHIHAPCDIGFLMHDALNVDIKTSWQRYQERERHWQEHLDKACDIVRKSQPDLIVSDVGEMPLAAGQALGIPTVAMSSLNWADIARFYFFDMRDSQAVLDRIAAIYDNTTLALRLSPGMPMRGQREQVLPAVGALSNIPRAEMEECLSANLHYPKRPRLLVGMGGITTDLPIHQWPKQTALNLLVVNQHNLPITGDPERGIVNANVLRAQYGWNFCDLLSISDVVICKPGYGTFVEAALSGCPVLYVKRHEWPEQTVLIDWLQQHACCAELTMGDLSQGNFDAAFTTLMVKERRPAIPDNGAAIAAQAILNLLN